MSEYRTGPAPLRPQTPESLCRVSALSPDEVRDAHAFGLNPDDYVAVDIAATGMQLGLAPEGSIQLMPAAILPGTLITAQPSRLLVGVNPQAAAGMLMESLGMVGAPVVRVVLKRTAIREDARPALEPVDDVSLDLPFPARLRFPVEEE